MKRSSLQRRTPLSSGKKKLQAKKGLKSADLDALLGSGKVQRASTFTAKPKMIRKRAKNNEGWYRWAVENVWEKRPHECEVCKCPLEEPAPVVFSHLLPRGSYRRYKLDERNVRLHCAGCHAEWHQYGPAALAFNPMWRKTSELYFKLRDEANGLNPRSDDHH